MMSTSRFLLTVTASVCLPVAVGSLPGVVSAQETTDNTVWNPPAEAAQAYYIIPLSVVDNAAPQHQLEPTATTVAAQPPLPTAAPQTMAAAPAAEAKPAVKAVHKGKASYYGSKFHGSKTASGERFDQNKLTCAHGSLPFGCRLRVTNMRNNKSVEVKVNDRGAFHKYDRIVDLSKAAAKKIGMLRSGVAEVKIEVLE